MRVDWRGIPYRNGYIPESALRDEAFQSSVWAATINSLADTCGASRRKVAQVLGRDGAPSSPFRIRAYW